MVVHAHAAAPDSLDEIYRELQPQLVRYAEGLLGDHEDAEEAVQDAFLAATRTLSRDSIDEPRPWMYRVTRNASIDLMRRRRPAVTLDDVSGGLAAGGASPHDAAELSGELETLRRGLDELSEQQRSALVLRELNGLAYAEIGTVLGVSEANVKVLIFRARKHLQAVADATRLTCGEAQVALSARADGELAVAAAARARLHTAHCRDCRGFVKAVGRQSQGLAALFPVAGLGAGLLGGAGAGAAASAGAKAGGGIGGLITSKLAVTAAATAIVVGGGGVAAYETNHVLHHGHHLRPPSGTTQQGGQAGAGATEPGDDSNLHHGRGSDDAPGSDDHGGNSGPGGGGHGSDDSGSGSSHSGSGSGSGSGSDDSGSSGSGSTSGGSGKTSGSSGSGSGETESGGSKHGG